MLTLRAVQARIFVLVAHVQITAFGSDVLAPVFSAAQGFVCVENCASNGAVAYHIPDYHGSEHYRGLSDANMSQAGFHTTPIDENGELFGPQRPRLAVRLYYVIKSTDLLQLGTAVLCTVLGIRMMVVPGRVWWRVWQIGGHITSCLFWTFVLLIAAPPAMALCFISGASFVMIGAAMLFLLLR
jgi:hypothetical protein